MMMHILLLGYSSIAQRRIIPALESIDQVDAIDIACQRPNLDIKHTKAGTTYRDYEDALANSRADVVYVSLINGLHYRWVKAALESGYHVIVDKPAFLLSSDAETMVALAKQANRALIEATVFVYHPQVQKIKELIAASEHKPLRLTTLFSFPPMSSDNFRYEKSLGGGALHDLGTYAIAAAKLIFKDEPRDLVVQINSQRDDVDISFSVLMSYSHGRSMIGHFGFDTQYQNRLSILADNFCAEIDRIFTLPADTKNSIHVSRDGDKSEIDIAPSDMFANFFTSVFTSLQKDDFDNYSSELLQNAYMHERLIQSARSCHD